MDDPMVRDTVIATAHAIAERTGVALTGLSTQADSITVTLAIDKLAAIGFMAELRRLTNAWYAKKFPDAIAEGPLWGTPPQGGGDDASAWDGFE